MNILILNGSPKGSGSITWQTSRFLEKKFPEHSFETLHLGSRIKALEKDFTPALEAIARADLLIFSYPVYTFIAPSQLHKFIALLKAHRVDFSGKAATQISTSKHFYDITAHRYIQDNCADMGLNYIRGLSADMDDLLTEKGQREAENFFKHLVWQLEKGYFEAVPAPRPPFIPVPVTAVEASPEAKPGDVVIIADLAPEDAQLAAMIARFRAKLPYATRVVNLREYPFRGGCLGCFHCAGDGKCIYTDGFDEFLRNNIQTAQSMVYAFPIRDHSMGPLFKLYDDRQFCNGHRTVTIGMPLGYLISGRLSAEENLQTIIEGRAQVGSNILAGIATDEADPDAAIDRLAQELTYSLVHKNTQPQNFYGIGGMKIFRDLIYQMRGMMKADHKFFKAHGQYDFPQKNPGRILLMYLVGALQSNPRLSKKLGNKMTEGMLMPYNKLLDSIQ